MSRAAPRLECRGPTPRSWNTRCGNNPGLHHSIVALAAVAGLCLAAACRVQGNHVLLAGWILPGMCYWNECFGLACPGCGITRGVVSCLHGAWGEGWRWNPAALPFAFLLLLQPPARLWAIWRIARRRSEPPIETVSFWVALTVVVVMAAQAGGRWAGWLG